MSSPISTTKLLQGMDMMCMYLHRVIAMKHVLPLLVISLLILAALVECAAASLSINVSLHPTRWNMPSPLEIHGTFSESTSVGNSFTISISATLPYDGFGGSGGGSSDADPVVIPLHGSTKECYAILDDSRSQTVLVTQMEPPEQTTMKITIEGSETMAFQQFYIWCHAVVLELPSNINHITESATADYLFTNTYDTNELMIPASVVQHPTIIHHYTWKTNQDPVVKVTFSFYRPSTMSDVPEFYLDHPLLRVDRITSIHLPPGSSYVEDLRRPYHLLTRTDYPEGILCSSTDQRSLVSRILFPRDPISDKVIPVISLPTTADGAFPNRPFICSFTIDYPADVLHASMYSSEDTNEKLTATIHQKSNGDSFPNIPLGVPRMIPYAKTSSLPPGVLIWHSPHHQLHGNTIDGLVQIEVAVLTSSLYYEFRSNSLNTIPSPRTEMLFEVVSLVGQEPSLLSDWEVTIKCRQHTSPDGEHISFDHGVIDLTHPSFHGLGQTCRITLLKPPEQYEYLTNMLRKTSLILVFRQDGIIHRNFAWIKVFDAFHRPGHVMNWLETHNTSQILPDLPPQDDPVSIPLTTYKAAGSGRTYARVAMNLQYLLPYPSFTAFSLCLAFNKGSELLQVVDRADSTTITGRMVVQKASSSYPLLDTEISLRASHVNFWNVLPGNPEDPEYITASTTSATSTAFQPGQPLRAPSLRMIHSSLGVVLDSKQSIHVTLEWELPSNADSDAVDGMVVYPLLLSYMDNLGPIYSHVYARITPIRTAPLTGYSYRCVTWDRMAAPYVYGGGTELLTAVNSSICPLYKPNEALDHSIWRRTELENAYGIMECFYELAAVCVTPSTTVEGAYDVHPLADCPSFFGTVHAIPCSVVEGDSPLASGYSIGPMLADILEPEIDDGGDDDGDDDDDGGHDNDDDKNHHVYKKRSLALQWVYTGDSRLTLTVAIKAVRKIENDSNDDNNNDNDDNNNAEHGPHGWITLARDILAYPHYKIIEFPVLNPSMKGVLVRLTLNGVSGVSHTINIPHMKDEEHWDIAMTGCKSHENKMFDDITSLCTCRDGFISSNPPSVDNPLVHPSEFTCEPKPSDDVPSTSKQCHSIPKGVTPPYRTHQCGYGFAVNRNGKCEDCECFGAWKLGTNNDDNSNYGNDDDAGGKEKCERCRLKDVCHSTQTAEITFKPEYCLVERCLCKAGYSGDKCQYAVMYGTLAYHDVATDEQKASLANANKEHPVIVPRRLITAFHPRVTNNVKASLGDTPVEAFVQQATQVLSDDGEEVITSIMVALGRLTDTDVSPSPSPFTLATGDGSNSNDLGDLHYAWEQLQNNYQDRPVYKDDDYGTLNGGVGSAYDPHCVPNAYTYCPDGKEDDLLPPESQVDEDELQDIYEEPSSTDHTTTYIIIGVVVGAVLLLFILLIVSSLYCRKHEKMCFRKRKTTKRAKGDRTSDDSRSVELASSNNLNKSQTPTSTLPPSSTMSTSSYLPTQVAIADPTLPADWIALEDKSTGKIYYSNKVTMESSWDHPAKPKEEKVAGAYGW